MWQIVLSVSRKADLGAVVIGESPIQAVNVYSERQILIEALEKWILVLDDYLTFGDALKCQSRIQKEPYSC